MDHAHFFLSSQRFCKNARFCKRVVSISVVRRYGNFSHSLRRPSLLGPSKPEATSLPHRPEGQSWVCCSEEDDNRGHHGAVQYHERDLIVRKTAAETSTELSDAEGASD